MRTCVPTFLALIILTLFSSQAKAHPGESRPVRVILGSVETKNWEQNLVKNNPNLAHYHWNPVYSSVQGTQLLTPMPRPPAQGTVPPGKNVGSPHVVFHPARPRPPVYSKPRQIPPQRNTSTSLDYKHAQPAHDLTGRILPKKPQNTFDPQVFAQLRNQQLGGQLLRKPDGAVAKSLPAEGRVSGLLKPKRQHNHSKHVSAKLASRPHSTNQSVSGKLITPPKALSYESYDVDPSGYSTTTSIKGRMAAVPRNY